MLFRSPTFSGYFGREWPAAIGESDRALDGIERFSSRAARCYFLHRIPAIAALRGQARFDRMVASCPMPVG